MSSTPPPAPPPALGRRLTWVDAVLAAALGITFTVLLLRTAGTLGYARDEGFYFDAANAYGRWFQLLWDKPGAALDRKAIDSAWAVNHEHPGLIKSLFALSHQLLQRRLHLFAMEGTSYRFPAMLLSGGLVSLVYTWGAQVRGRAAGLVAAVALAAMPRVFFHAHLACFDLPIVAVWTLCAYCFWRAVGTPRGVAWPLLTAVTFGLALDTKHNSWFLPIVFGAHTIAALAAARALRAVRDPDALHAPHAPERAAAATLQLRRAVFTLALMALVGPLLFVALWPWLWHDTFARFAEYARFHLNHDYYNMEFLGENYWQPPMPRSYALVMTAATVPLVTLLLAAAGLFARARLRLAEAAHLAASLRRARLPWLTARPLGSALARRGPTASTELLWLLAIGAIYAAWLSPKTPIFGGTKHWMTAYPFLALFAGVGFDDLTRAARAQLLHLRRRAPSLARRARLPHLAAALAAFVLASPIVQTARSHPWGLSAYTPLVGGASGAATLGLNRTFWGYTTGAVTDYLNEAAPPGGAPVFLHDTLGPSWQMLVDDGRLRRDLRAAASIDASFFGLYHHELHMQGMEYQAWVTYETVRPAHIAGLDGVPVIWVYRRP